MLTRALIVVLAILNLGVATWWLLRDEPARAPLPPPPTGVAELRWLPGGTDAAVAACAGAAPAELPGVVTVSASGDQNGLFSVS